MVQSIKDECFSKYQRQPIHQNIILHNYKIKYEKNYYLHTKKLIVSH